jgi:hypothetical protein
MDTGLLLTCRQGTTATNSSGAVVVQAASGCLGPAFRHERGEYIQKGFKTGKPTRSWRDVKPASPIWRPTTFVVPVPDSATNVAASSNRFSSFLVTLLSRQRSGTSEVSISYKMRSMTDLEFRSQATPIKPWPAQSGMTLAIASFIIH